MNTPTTRRYPRSLSEAFGPYHHLAPLQTEYMPMHKHDKIVVWGCAIAVVLIGVILYVA
jgi:hypothetical protein